MKRKYRVMLCVVAEILIGYVAFKNGLLAGTAALAGFSIGCLIGKGN